MPELDAFDSRALALVKAIHGGDHATLLDLLQQDDELSRARLVDRRGHARTLLHVVADWPGHFPGAARTVAILAAAGTPVDAGLHQPDRPGPGETALHWAASSGDLAVLDALLDAGADIEAPGAVLTGGSPLADAVVFAMWPAARRLVERGASATLWQAAALGQLRPVQDHLAASPSPTPAAVDNAFWHACRGGQLATAQLLLARGADPRRVGHDDKTPLAVATASGAPPLVAWLTEVLAGHPGTA